VAYNQYFNQYGSQFGVNPQVLSNIARLESSYDPGVMNTWDSNAQAGTPSGGLMQFIQPTFTSFLGDAQRQNPGTFGKWSAGDWMDPEAQVAVASHALSQGKGSHWATYGKALQGTTGLRSHQPTYGGITPRMTQSSTPSGGLTPYRRELIRQAFSEDPGIGSAHIGRLSGGGVPRLSPSPSGSGGGAPSYGGFIPRLENEPHWRWAQRIGSQLWGLRNDPGTGQTTGGEHAPGSLHYVGKAIDWGDALNDREQLQAAYDYFDKNREAYGISELIWQAPGHYDHIHVGFR
jgi:hypothetical protein